MTIAQALTRIERVQKQALTNAAQVALTQVIPFVPINTGALRESGKVESKGKEVHLVFGGKGSTGKGEQSVSPNEYAAYQYSKAKRHYLSGGKLGRLLELFTGSAKKAAQGAKDKARYSAAYRQVKDQLTVFPNGVRWFKIILRSKEIQEKMAKVYARSF